MNEQYFGFEYMSGPRSIWVSSGNPVTHRHNIAGKLAIFDKESELIDWISEGEYTSPMAGNCRKRLTKKEARQHVLAITSTEFKELIDEEWIEYPTIIDTTLRN